MLRKLVVRAATVFVGAALLGLLAWLIFVQVTGATLVIFRTGSMAPAIPQGALAVSLPVAANQIKVGDVVTVPRSSDGLPITHRVAEIRAVGPSGAVAPSTITSRELVLKGDANSTTDPRPYVVDEARRVVVSVPKLGSVLMLLKSAIGLGSLSLLAGSLAVWSFWPKSHDRPLRGRHRASRAAARNRNRVHS